MEHPIKPVDLTAVALQDHRAAAAAALGASFIAVPRPAPVEERAAWDGHARVSAPPVCHCGAWLTTCLGCWSDRCLVCDPYSSDDCRYRDC